MFVLLFIFADSAESGTGYSFDETFSHLIKYTDIMIFFLLLQQIGTHNLLA